MGWVLAIRILNVCSVSLIVVGVAIVCNQNEIGVGIVIVVLPPVISSISSWGIGYVPHWSFWRGVVPVVP